jgi:hypothetical protein
MINVDDEMLESGLPAHPGLSFDRIKGDRKVRKHHTPGISPLKVVSDSPNQKSISSDTIINLNQPAGTDLFPSKPQLSLKVSN